MSQNAMPEAKIRAEKIGKRKDRAAGYEFTGWYVDEARTLRINPSAKLGQTVTLYDKWMPIQYPITYHLDTGINNRKNPRTVCVESGVLKLYPPLQKKRFFKGWSWKGKIVEYLPENLTEPVELYAVFADTPAVSFETGMGGNIEPRLVDAKGYLHPFRPPVRIGCQFDGWYFDPDYRVKFEFSMRIHENTTLYAKWKPVEYEIEYDLNQGRFIQEPATSFEYSTPTFLLESPVRAGWKFDGWLDRRGRKVQAIYQHSSGNRLFKASWVRLEPEVHAMEGAGWTEKTVLTETDSETLPIQTKTAAKAAKKPETAKQKPVKSVLNNFLSLKLAEVKDEPLESQTASAAYIELASEENSGSARETFISAPDTSEALAQAEKEILEAHEKEQQELNYAQGDFVYIDDDETDDKIPESPEDSENTEQPQE